MNLAIPIIAHAAKFQSASSVLRTNPHPFNLNTGPGINMDLNETYVLTGESFQAATHNQQTTKDLIPPLQWKLNYPKRIVRGQLVASGRTLQSYDWIQLGLDIDGEATNDYSGSSVSLSSNGTVVAVAAPNNDPNGCTNAGHVRIYNFNGTEWTQLGLDIDGESTADYSGSSVSLSSDGTVVAVGTPNNDPNGHTDAGCVRVYNFNGTGWTQLGLNIDGEANGDYSGSSVSLSSNGRVLAVGAPLYDASSGGNAGHVQVYNFNGTGWTQLGLDIDGEAAGDRFGWSVSLSSDGSVLAVGAPLNDASNPPNAGYVRVFNFNGTGWTQLGLDIDGEAPGDYSGWSVSLSSDGSILAVGAPNSDPSSRTDAGHVQVYNFNGTGWTQLGLNIDGEAPNDQSGFAISLSGDGSLLAVGAPNYDQSVRVYNFNGIGWTQIGRDIHGEAAGDYSGWSVSLSRDGSVLAVGAPYNNPSCCFHAGHVRVYKSISTTTNPSKHPTMSPTRGLSAFPTTSPSKSPFMSPTKSPTEILTIAPTNPPTSSKSPPTRGPSSSPATSPSKSPIMSPSKSPTEVPTVAPMNPPTSIPTSKSSPSSGPSVSRTTSPSKSPIMSPTKLYTEIPTVPPTNPPTSFPTSKFSFTRGPSASPTTSPSRSSIISPTKSPQEIPTVAPTNPPTSISMSKSGKTPKAYPTLTSKPTLANKSGKRA